MNKKLGQEPAFPKPELFTYSTDGMSKRFYAACVAMQGMLTNMPFLEANVKTAKQQLMKADEFLVFTAYSLADELLKQEYEQ